MRILLQLPWAPVPTRKERAGRRCSDMVDPRELTRRDTCPISELHPQLEHSTCSLRCVLQSGVRQVSVSSTRACAPRAHRLPQAEPPRSQTRTRSCAAGRGAAHPRDPRADGRSAKRRRRMRHDLLPGRARRKTSTSSGAAADVSTSAGGGDDSSGAAGDTDTESTAGAGGATDGCSCSTEGSGSTWGLLLLGVVFGFRRRSAR